jgi:serine/threonine protein kinase
MVSVIPEKPIGSSTAPCEMQDEFDPYYRWLGISPKDQPPNHYRLLGVEVLENDADVISYAADRQMGYVRTFQSGKHSAASQKILNEIAAARVCLLDPAKKKAYDDELRAKLSSAVSAASATSATTAPAADFDGAAFGEYLLMDHLGVGGTGQVFKAQHRTLGRTVALKILSREATKSAELVARFRLKVSILGRLSHPNLVAAYDAGEKEETHYLIMEYVDGWDLITLIREYGSLPAGHVIDYVTQAAEGLACAHAQSIYHRNVKPNNVLIDKQGMIKVIGLGMARFANQAALAETGIMAEFAEQGRMIGSLDYMAPEQAIDSSQADQRSDVYSLGYTLYTALTKQLPYPVKSPRDKVVAHRTHPTPALRATRPDVPAGLEAVYQRMVAKQPHERFQSMREVIAALKACEQQIDAGAPTTITAPAIQPNTPVSAADPLSGFLQQLAAEEPHWKRKK